MFDSAVPSPSCVHYVLGCALPIHLLCFPFFPRFTPPPPKSLVFLCCSRSSAMEISLPPVQPRGTDLSWPTCRDTQCGSHGTCVAPPGGGTKFVCDCDLGYKGEFCKGTFNGALSVPLTTSVLVVIVGLVILAFVIAKLRRKQQKKLR